MIEMIVVLGIIAIISAVAFVGSQSFNKSVIVTDTAYTVALSVRQAQNLGLSSRKFTTTGNTVTTNAGYGVHFAASTPTTYTVFADTLNSPLSIPTWCPTGIAGTPEAKPGNCLYDSATETQRAYTLNRGFTISNVCGNDTGNTTTYCTSTGALTAVDIAFLRPNTESIITGFNSSGKIQLSDAKIHIRSPEGVEKCVVVSQVGEVAVLNATDTQCANLGSGGGGGGGGTAATCTLTPNSASITQGSSTGLNWQTANANGLTITASSGASPGTVAPVGSGSTPVSPTVTTTYTGTVTGASGNGTCSTTVTVTSGSPLPTCTLSLSPTSIITGSTATLTWSSTNGSVGGMSISPTPGPVVLNGSQPVNPSVTTTYTGTINGPGGSNTCNATLTVTAGGGGGGGTPIVCSVQSQNVRTVNYTTTPSPGFGPYTWVSEAGTAPGCSGGGSCSVTYPSAGTYHMQVTPGTTYTTGTCAAVTVP